MALSAAAKYRKVQKRLLHVPAQIAKDAALAIEKDWRRKYMASQDPYGNEWAALKPSTIMRKGHDWIMVRSEETLNMTRVRPMAGAGISLRTGPNAAHHLEPTSHRPARPLLPLYGLPKKWRELIEQAYIARGKKAVSG